MVRRLLAGGVPGPGVVVEGVIEVKLTFKATRNRRNQQKTCGFAHVLANKSLKTPFFAQKYLTRYTHKMFLRNTSILKLFITQAIVELYLFKVSEVIYAPSRTDKG